MGPELGPLAALYVAPEAGTWHLDEVDVCSSRTGHMDRCVHLGPGAIIVALEQTWWACLE